MSKKSISRRGFVSLVSKAGALGALISTPFISKAGELIKEEEEFGFLTLPYLQSPTATSITIMWLTNKKAFCWIDYGENGILDKKAYASHNGLIEANCGLNKIKLENLESGKVYQYRVVAKEILDFKPYKVTYGKTLNSESYSFKTFETKSDNVSMLIMNDLHDRPESIGHLINLNKNDPYDLIFFNGDMFDYQTDEKQIINHMLKPCTDAFATKTPFMYVRGNHETRGKFAREFVNYFDNISGNFFFAFTQGPVRFVCLDTGEDKEDTHPVYAGIVDFDHYREVQAQWLANEIKKPEFRKASFRVVLMHIPHYYSEEEHGSTHSRKMFADLFNKGKVDMVICGHTHTYKVHDRKPGTHNYPIIIGGGPQNGERTLIKLKANTRKLSLQMLNDNGNEVGSYALGKDARKQDWSI
ncbi:metallophosphoesterase family protein [Solitalea sp. MAHUQ-68]|uniref:Metallophosphoesterase family protein n=1 Tax=Solitalea agri TaxID=2953739 RepID=A0A9X2F2C1_9SPHI|nr:metallophosphoesterase family protein [Solitalea agri]MCO4293387.1 metallophosphoesterase family protein [Solitalea agri]